jgi:hypothetical protein
MRVSIAVIALSALLAPACSSPAKPAETPAGPQSFSGTVAGLGAASHDVTMASAGTATVTLTWTAATVDLDLYLTSSACTVYPRTSTLSVCTILSSSTSATGVREELTMSVAKNQALRVWVDNFSAASSGYAINVTIQ